MRIDNVIPYASQIVPGLFPANHWMLKSAAISLHEFIIAVRIALLLRCRLVKITRDQHDVVSGFHSESTAASAPSVLA